MPVFTSSHAARVLRVGVSSIKRWTDEGELEAIRTPGGHRRYTTLALLEFASARGLPVDLLPAPAESLPPPADVSLFDALSRGDTAAVRRLVHPSVETIAKRATFLDRVVGDALREIGYRWERSALSVYEEHRATHLISEAIDALRAPQRPGSKLAMLACPPGEQHELPLHLVRLILEWSGWRADLLGASLPWEAAHAAVTRERPAIFAFTSRTAEPYRYRDFDRFVEFCNRRGVEVLVGGDWARGGTGRMAGYVRFRTLRGFERWLRGRPDYFPAGEALWRGHVRQPAGQDGSGLQDPARRSQSQ